MVANITVDIRKDTTCQLVHSEEGYNVELTSGDNEYQTTVTFVFGSMLQAESVALGFELCGATRLSPREEQ